MGHFGYDNRSIWNKMFYVKWNLFEYILELLGSVSCAYGSAYNIHHNEIEKNITIDIEEPGFNLVDQIGACVIGFSKNQHGMSIKGKGMKCALVKLLEVGQSAIIYSRNEKYGRFKLVFKQTKPVNEKDKIGEPDVSIFSDAYVEVNKEFAAQRATGTNCTDCKPYDSSDHSRATTGTTYCIPWGEEGPEHMEQVWRALVKTEQLHIAEEKVSVKVSRTYKDEINKTTVQCVGDTNDKEWFKQFKPFLPSSSDNDFEVIIYYAKLKLPVPEGSCKPMRKAQWCLITNKDVINNENEPELWVRTAASRAKAQTPLVKKDYKADCGIQDLLAWIEDKWNQSEPLGNGEELKEKAVIRLCNRFNEQERYKKQDWIKSRDGYSSGVSKLSLTPHQGMYITCGDSLISTTPDRSAGNRLYDRPAAVGGNYSGFLTYHSVTDPENRINAAVVSIFDKKQEPATIRATNQPVLWHYLQKIQKKNWVLDASKREKEKKEQKTEEIFKIEALETAEYIGTEEVNVNLGKNEKISPVPAEENFKIEAGGEAEECVGTEEAGVSYTISELHEDEGEDTQYETAKEAPLNIVGAEMTGAVAPVQQVEDMSMIPPQNRRGHYKLWEKSFYAFTLKGSVDWRPNDKVTYNLGWSGRGKMVRMDEHQRGHPHNACEIVLQFDYKEQDPKNSQFERNIHYTMQQMGFQFATWASKDSEYVLVDKEINLKEMLIGIIDEEKERMHIKGEYVVPTWKCKRERAITIQRAELP